MTRWVGMTVSAGRIVVLAIAALTFVLVFASCAYASFGVVPGGFKTTALNEDGTLDTQAGSHPYEYVVRFSFNLDSKEIVEGSVRDIDVELPPGLVGDPNVIPRCTRQEFEGTFATCSANTQVGILRTVIAGQFLQLPLYSLVPPAGVPFAMAFQAEGLNILEYASARTGSDYGVNVDTNNIPVKETSFVEEIIWGVPATSGHNAQRSCFTEEGGKLHRFEGCASSVAPRALLTLPTQCSTPLQAQIRVDSVEEPSNLLAPLSAFSLDGGGNPAGLTGCERLSFEPDLKIAPDTVNADTPAGLTTTLNVPQAGLQSPEGLSSSTVNNTRVVLPEGVAINPGKAAGLQACQHGESAIGTGGPAQCPNASKVGTVSIKTPLLQEELAGNVYLLPGNPPNIELLVAANDPVDGVYLKLIGKVHLEENTGRLTTTFSETPPLPFSSFKLSFSGGAQAALSTPLRCGTYQTTTDFTPWSTPFGKDLITTSGFAIEHGTDGAPCPPNPLPFTPNLIAGSTTDQAGGYTDFSVLLTRPDDQQRVSTLQFKAPEGLLGDIAKVPLCPEQQAAQGACSEASQIGHATVEAGPGPYPLVIPEQGHPPDPIYLTGPYKGAPYGLSIVTRLLVGPFDLGTIVTRAKIEVDPLTAQITVTTDSLPQTVDGVPSDLRTIDAVIDKPGFMFNPTDCSPMSFSGAATSIEGAQAPISSPFQMGSCRSLTFKPNFKVSTSGKTSRQNGASLTAKILYPIGALGANQASSQSNIARVKVDLPKQLPSRLTTLQKACSSGQFEANPAGCPAGSIVGHATAITPVLPVPVTGPAYFVSYGGAKFPELVFVLQGYGVTIHLHGETFINKAGITSSTFRHVPDVPITSFELTLPQGPDSALAANGNLCALTKTVLAKRKVKVRSKGHTRTITRQVPTTLPASLAMPTAFTAQNGMVIKQNTPITVTGCGKGKRAKASGRGKHRGRK